MRYTNIAYSFSGVSLGICALVPIFRVIQAIIWGSFSLQTMGNKLVEASGGIIIGVISYLAIRREFLFLDQKLVGRESDTFAGTRYTAHATGERNTLIIVDVKVGQWRTRSGDLTIGTEVTPLSTQVAVMSAILCRKGHLRHEILIHSSVQWELSIVVCDYGNVSSRVAQFELWAAGGNSMIRMQNGREIRRIIQE